MIDPPDAIFFDLDGTLLDPSNATLESDWRAACEACCDGAFDIDATVPHLHPVRTGLWTDTQWARRSRFDLAWASASFVRAVFAKVDLTDDALADRIGAEYFVRREAAAALYPAATATLERVRAMGIATALITNGAAAMQRGKVERFALASYFDCIVIEGEFGCGKPDERVFRHALASTGCEPERAWMVGDFLEADIETPHRLGMQTVWIDEDGAGLPAGSLVQPHRIVRSIADLL